MVARGVILAQPLLGNKRDTTCTIISTASQKPKHSTVARKPSKSGMPGQPPRRRFFFLLFQLPGYRSAGCRRACVGVRRKCCQRCPECTSSVRGHLRRGPRGSGEAGGRLRPHQRGRGSCLDRLRLGGPLRRLRWRQDLGVGDRWRG